MEVIRFDVNEGTDATDATDGITEVCISCGGGVLRLDRSSQKSCLDRFRKVLLSFLLK